MDIILGYVQTGFSAVFAFILLLGLLIFVHELGHFAVAKWCGVRVEVFSLGFGKKLWSYKRGDTTYCVSLIPLGGYVKMFGDEVGASMSEADKPFSFSHKPVGQRIAVVLAGPLMNFFFAIFIFAIVAFIGEEVRAPIIGDLNTASKAYEAGLRPGDRVTQVGSQDVHSWEQFQEGLNRGVNSTVHLMVQRHGTKEPVRVDVKPEPRPNINVLSLDTTMGEVEGLTNMSKASVVGVRPGSLAEKAGLKTGDRILTINGVEVRFFRDLETVLVPHQNQDINLEIERAIGTDGKTEKAKITTNFKSFASLNAVGIESSELYLLKVVPNSPAHNAGLMSGDRVIKVGDKTPMAWDDVLQSVKGYAGEGELPFMVEREGGQKTFAVKPEMTSQMNMQGGEEKRYTIGIIPWIQVTTPEFVALPVGGFFGGIKRGVVRTWEVTVMTAVSFLRLIQTKISPKNIGGVISIGQAAHETLKMGIAQFLTMMGLISVNLFVLNLLPIPVLDGGHLLFYTVEAIKGAPLNMRKIEIAQQIGLFVLMSLMVFALFNDVTRIFGM